MFMAPVASALAASDTSRQSIRPHSDLFVIISRQARQFEARRQEVHVLISYSALVYTILMSLGVLPPLPSAAYGRRGGAVVHRLPGVRSCVQQMLARDATR
ncbi:jg17741 [Pararge aegeria aegeria]|uniref:Jg17741 protein n=1 Tax=Pararge aegeria aegeria TaxID=348720 RepID=A0A8S4SD17_9NEOP|nr:jg17741 [Pararge aegeria aegeria]